MVACTECLTLDSAVANESVCVCVSCLAWPGLACHLAGLSPTDLVPLSSDIIRAVFSLGQIVLSETQIA